MLSRQMSHSLPSISFRSQATSPRKTSSKLWCSSWSSEWSPFCLILPAPWKPSHFPRELTGVLSRRYFTIFDSKDRSGLLDAYHDNVSAAPSTTLLARRRELLAWICYFHTAFTLLSHAFTLLSYAFTLVLHYFLILLRDFHMFLQWFYIAFSCFCTAFRLLMHVFMLWHRFYVVWTLLHCCFYIVCMCFHTAFTLLSNTFMLSQALHAKA